MLLSSENYSLLCILSVHSQLTSNSPKRQAEKHILAKERHLGTEQLDYKGAACTPGVIKSTASIIHL